VVRKLREFLGEERVEHADILTTSILLGAAGRGRSGFLQLKEREAIEPRLLAEIDAVWSQWSLGEYGFRTQLQLRSGPPPGARPGGQRDFFALARAIGWDGGERVATPRYGEFVSSGKRPAGFFPTLRNPQLERLSDWYDHWMQTVLAVHLRLREWSSKKS
jgi:hypothetical protein